MGLGHTLTSVTSVVNDNGALDRDGDINLCPDLVVDIYAGMFAFQGHDQ